jgi:hemerythrin-like metal-binding protein
MHRFEMSPSLTTGNRDIDTQLATLFDLANDILFTQPEDAPPAAMRAAVSHLFSFLEYHFASEELAMLEHSYPSRRFHGAFHDHVRREARSITGRMARSASMDEVRSAIFFLLEDWVVYHVAEADRHLATYLHEQTPAGSAPSLPGLRPLKAAGTLAPDFEVRLQARTFGLQ